ncbi:cache domain-containing protein, partial [Campylobacter ornithocola]|uniref:cache domain-containing protein n=1 Tax=Campylobacter ornithocola TaxID=1848766 RepID=UPI001AE04543
MGFSVSRSLSSKLTWVMCISIVFIVIVINVVSYLNSKNSTFNYLTEIQVKTMMDVDAMYNSYGKSRRLAIETLAEHFSNYISNMSEQEIINTLKLAEKTSDFELVYVGFEDSGKNYQSDNEILDLSKGYDTKNRGWYKEAKAAGKLIVTDPYKSVSSGQMGITYTAPIYNNGKLIAVVGGD